MKLLLTSAGLTNASIINALQGVVGKPFGESNIVVVPTAHNPVPGDKGWLLEEDFINPYQLGWKRFSVVDLAAVERLDKDLWWPEFEQADVVLVGGGGTFYLSYWLQQSGLFDVLPQWLKSKVYIGISAGSQVAGANLRSTGEALDAGPLSDDEYDEIGPTSQSSGKALGLVDFAFRPHLNSPDFPKIRKDYLEGVAKTLNVPMYALDDQSAIKVIDDSVEIVSEGTWHFFE